MRILHVNKYYSPWIGGVESVVKEVSEGLRSLGVDVNVLVCQEKGKPSAVEQIDGIHVTKTKTIVTIMRLPISLSFFTEFRKQAQDADIIFLHHPFPLGFLAYALFGKGKPLVIYYHSDIVRQKLTGALIRPLIKNVLTKAKTIFVSNSQTKRLSELLKPFQHKTTVVPLWIDESLFERTQERNEIVSQIRNQYGSPLVLAVGRLIYYKGFSHLVRAMQNINAQLVIVGDGPMKTELLDQVSKLDLNDKVHIINPVDDLVPYYYAADIFVLPSTHPSEVFGIVQLEAMFCGCPVINTNLPTGVPEVSLHEKTGLTVEPGNADHLAKALTDLITNTDKRKHLGLAAKERAHYHFSKERSLKIILESLRV